MSGDRDRAPGCSRLSATYELIQVDEDTAEEGPNFLKGRCAPRGFLGGRARRSEASERCDASELTVRTQCTQVVCTGVPLLLRALWLLRLLLLAGCVRAGRAPRSELMCAPQVTFTWQVTFKCGSWLHQAEHGV